MSSQPVERDFRDRAAHNPRYSLRAYARWLGVDHSTLSQPRTVEQIGR